MSLQQESLTEILAKWLPPKDFDLIEDTDPVEFESQGVRLTTSEKAQIQTYIQTPTSQGYWRLTGVWRYDGKFSKYIYAAHASSFKQFPGNKRNAARPYDEKYFVEKIASRLAPLLDIFNYARKMETNPDDAHDLAEPNTQQFIKHIDWIDFRVMFKDAMDIFIKKIYFDGFNPKFYINSFSGLAMGSLCTLVGPADSSTIKFAAADEKPLKALGEFLNAAGQLEDLAIDRVFSPEEDLIDPYFTFLSSIFTTVLPDHRLQQQIKRAFEHFERKDYSHCVGALGLVAEDHLTQVFESYLREACPRGQTLGQVFDMLHTRINDLLTPPKEKLANLDALYDQINALQKNNELEANTLDKEQLEGLFRSIVSTLIADRKYFNHRLDDISSKGPRISVFPKAIYTNIDELIRHRNAASHKTRIPIGRYEALRSLYCLMAMILWWRAEKAQIIWSDDKMDIIKNAVQRSKLLKH